MKQQVLNLLNPQKSDIQCRTLTFNDGEPHIWIDGIDHKARVSVLCRVANPNDLFILMQVADILNRHGVLWDLWVTYLMGARMDRVMSFSEAFSLKIVCDTINAMRPQLLRVLEPHSEIIQAHVKMLMWPFMRNNELCSDYSPGDVSGHILILPDAGAKDRYGHYALSALTITADKHRDPKTGRVLSLNLCEGADKVVEVNPDKPFLVLDDLCDGGGTFVALAEILAERYPAHKRHIFVTHMVNPKGIENLARHYHQVTFTNSYRDWQDEQLPPNVTVKSIDIKPHETA